MRLYNTHEAKTYLSQLVEQATQRGAFVIAKRVSPWKVTAVATPEHTEVPTRVYGRTDPRR